MLYWWRFHKKNRESFVLMKILLTNDDGILADGIYALYLELKKIAQVTVVAPDSERSSIGHAITLSHPIWYKRFNVQSSFFGYGISGTPADCVKFGVDIILKKSKPDLVISGINLGCNDGCSVIYSGTVAGAREGALLGIPSIAISLDTFVSPDFRYAAKCGARLAKIFAKKKMPKGTFLNANVPNLKPSQVKGIRYTKQGIEPIHSSFQKRTDPHLRNYYWMTGKMPAKKTDLSFDTYALNQGYVTVVPIKTDTTDYTFLDELTNVAD
jgi:5'-nucleotidase